MNQSDLVKEKLAKIILKRKKRGELINLKTHCDGFRTHIKCKRTHDSYNDNRLFSDNVLTSTVLCHSCTLNINPTGIHRHKTLDAFQSHTGILLWHVFWFFKLSVRVKYNKMEKMFYTIIKYLCGECMDNTQKYYSFM